MPLLLTRSLHGAPTCLCTQTRQHPHRTRDMSGSSLVGPSPRGSTRPRSPWSFAFPFAFAADRAQDGRIKAGEGGLQDFLLGGQTRLF